MLNFFNLLKLGDSLKQTTTNIWYVKFDTEIMLNFLKFICPNV